MRYTHFVFIVRFYQPFHSSIYESRACNFVSVFFVIFFRFSYCISIYIQQIATDCTLILIYNENEIKFLIYTCVKRIMKPKTTKKNGKITRNRLCVAQLVLLLLLLDMFGHKNDTEDAAYEQQMTIENFHFVQTQNG